jgi:hypothetical protein
MFGLHCSSKLSANVSAFSSSEKTSPRVPRIGGSGFLFERSAFVLLQIELSSAMRDLSFLSHRSVIDEHEFDFVAEAVCFRPVNSAASSVGLAPGEIFCAN